MKFWAIFELVVGVLFAVESSLGLTQIVNVAKEGWWGPVTLGASILLAISGLMQLLPRVHSAAFVFVAALVSIAIATLAGQLSTRTWIFSVSLAFLAWTMQRLSSVAGRSEVGTLVCALTLSLALFNTTVSLFRLYWNDPSFLPLHKIFEFMSPIALPWTLVLILVVHSTRECLQPYSMQHETAHSQP